jgi:hypothetical protein
MIGMGLADEYQYAQIHVSMRGFPLVFACNGILHVISKPIPIRNTDDEKEG